MQGGVGVSQRALGAVELGVQRAQPVVEHRLARLRLLELGDRDRAVALDLLEAAPGPVELAADLVELGARVGAPHPRGHGQDETHGTQERQPPP